MNESVEMALETIDFLLQWNSIEDTLFHDQLIAYKNFYTSFLSAAAEAEHMDASMVVAQMRASGIQKLFDEPESYGTMHAKHILDGILGKHLRDLATLVRMYEEAESPLKERLYLELQKAVYSLPRKSPCLDAYTTELDRLVRVYSEPLEETRTVEGATLSKESFQHICDLNPIGTAGTDYEKAEAAFELFQSCCSHKTPQNFAVFLQAIQFYGNEWLGTLGIRSFQTVSNLLQAIHCVGSLEELMDLQQETF